MIYFKKTLFLQTVKYGQEVQQLGKRTCWSGFTLKPDFFSPLLIIGQRKTQDDIYISIIFSKVGFGVFLNTRENLPKDCHQTVLFQYNEMKLKCSTCAHLSQLQIVSLLKINEYPFLCCFYFFLCHNVFLCEWEERRKEGNYAPCLLSYQVFFWLCFFLFQSFIFSPNHLGLWTKFSVSRVQTPNQKRTFNVNNVSKNVSRKRIRNYVFLLDVSY